MINNIDFKIKNLAEIFKGKVIGNNNLSISGIGTIENAKKGDITFLSNNKYIKYIKSTKASAIIIDNKSLISKNSNTTFLIVKDAYTSFAVLLSQIQSS